MRLYGAAPSATELSPLVDQTCSANSIEEARASADSRFLSRLGSNAAAADRIIMTWYADEDYEGDMTDIRVDGDDCDSAGYRVEPDGYWKENISSIHGAFNCNTVRLTNRTLNYAEMQPLPTANLGNELNDNVGLTQVYRR